MASHAASRFPSRTAALVVFESTLIIGAVALATAIRLGAGEVWSVIGTTEGLMKAVLIAGVCQLCLYFADLYDLRVVADRRDLIVRVLQSLSATSILLAVLYFWFPALIIGRGVFLIAAFLVISTVVGWRLLFEWMARKVGNEEKLLLIGTTPAAVALARELHERRIELGVQIVGFVDADPSRVGQPLLNPGIIGTIDDIPAIVKNQGVDRVVVSLADARGRLPMEKLLEMKLGGVSFDHLASVYESYTGKIAIENLRPSWLIFSAGFRKNTTLVVVKRAMDICVAAIGLLLAAPILAVVAGLIKLTSPGPIFYSQRRVGQNGRIFTIRKLRSMRPDAEKGTGAVWSKGPADSRITPIGRILRKSRLDEVPQLWNVLIGDMSMVGPRPERPEFVQDLTRDIPYYGQRHVVKPGLTGWAQVCYTYGASVEDALQKLQYDLFYIKNLSIALDVFIIFKTVKTVVLRKGA
jgi:sugar transferase (PEP-CTERM system associated)